MVLCVFESSTPSSEGVSGGKGGGGGVYFAVRLLSIFPVALDVNMGFEAMFAGGYCCGDEKI